MLIDEIVEFCDKRYSTYGEKCGCESCNHPSGNCSDSCYNCLYQIHFPDRFTGPIKKIYDCPKMINHYVCQYSYLYASEILYAFNHKKQLLKQFDSFHLLSIACGACPDLMALEKFCCDNSIQKQIAFRGYDINPIWSPVHSEIKRYCDKNNIQRSFFEKDVLTCFSSNRVGRANIITISYLISYLYNTNQTNLIKTFFDDLSNNVILQKRPGEKALIIINDVNSNKRGRDYFNLLKTIIRKKGAKILSEYKYFDTGDLNYFQKIGSPYQSNACLFDIPQIIKSKYKVCDSHNKKTIQLILEVD